MSKHTPGPWEWNSKDQLVATTVMTQPYFDDEKTEPVVIIETDGGYYPPHGYDRLLLSAVPDLLALLIESQENIGGDWRERRDAAIAKAMGIA